MKKYILISLTLLSLSFFSIDKLDKKITKKLNKTFKDIDVVKTKMKSADDNVYWFKLSNKASKKELGYLGITQAKSHVDVFEYMIVFDLDKKIKSVDVLTYREQYGGEIGNKRFLKQFRGKNNKAPLRINKEINGIAGATISCNSITNSISGMTVKITSVK
jgi:Na+-translocating ferredoxin:NAD+ oxidoreductase RnfG subunit